jgi:hypothetical protein
MPMAQTQQFTTEEWRTLQFAPFWIFCALVGRYREFDELDFAAFTWALQSAVTGHGQLTSDVVASVVTDLDILRLRFELDNRSIVTGLFDVTVVLRKAPVEQAELFKQALLSQIGAGVARARGRYGKIISEDDERTLEYTSVFLTA